MDTPITKIQNPFRPGAGQPPPYLAGRTAELDEMKTLLNQTVILQNIILTGLRGIGKTVLLETLKPMAQGMGWLWVGTDLSESASISEERLAVRILTDLSVVTASFPVRQSNQLDLVGFAGSVRVVSHPLNYEILVQHFQSTPGLIADKLKSTLEFVWSALPQASIAGLVFAYDEAQNIADHAEKNEYPLSLMLEVFQSLQRKGIPFMLALTGLPTLFPKLVEARTYAERMFHVIFLKPLDEHSSQLAIRTPTMAPNCPVTFEDDAVDHIARLSGGYPYFIQFICKEVFDAWIAQMSTGKVAGVPEHEILRKLDTDFFQGRWARATDRQRELLQVIAALPNCDSEFTVQEVVAASREALAKGFTPSHANQMLVSLASAGLVYKNRHGKYSLAVPLMSRFIQRQTLDSVNLQLR
jgi:hypothetical protein